MFYYVSGTVEHMAPNLAVIDCGGVGYACRTSNNTLSYLKRGEKAVLYTYLHVREDLFELYGFATERELNFFNLLIGVSGVGPKAALSVLSNSTPENLAASIIMENEKALTVAPGIGKKTAQRIILELKDKLEKEEIRGGEPYGGADTPLIAGNKAGEAAAALSVLGYSQSEISTALRKIDIDSLALEDVIRRALRGLMK